jgi:glyoxylase-like metal-dependent hydrolase (beta-lactamase superfamily II)
MKKVEGDVRAWRTVGLGMGMIAALLASGCNLREYAVDVAVADQVHFVPDAEHLAGWDMKKVTERVYTFRWTWDRSIAVLTDEGWVVTDPMNAEAAGILKRELDRLAPGKPVHTMFYTHYHLDHVPGGAVLHPQNVVAHAKCPVYWKDLADTPATREIVPPTRLIEGDQKIVIGGVTFELLYLGQSHTDTLYAFYLPGEKLLHTADMGLVRTVFPIGGPDMYMPGVIRAMDRLAQLDFDTWIPSHFGFGKKSDFLEATEFSKTVRRLSLEALAKYGLPETEDGLKAGFHSVYDPLKLKYGHYHGFNQEALFIVARGFSGVLLGY